MNSRNWLPLLTALHWLILEVDPFCYFCDGILLMIVEEQFKRPNWCTWNDNIKMFYNFFQIFVNWGLILTILTLWKQLLGALYLHLFPFHFLVFGCWDLSHMIFLELRKKELLAKLSKFTTWQLFSPKTWK